MHFIIVLLMLVPVYYGKRIPFQRRVIRSEGGDWSYSGDNGPDHWPGVCQTGKTQSPIDIGGPRKVLDGKALKFDGAYDDKEDFVASWNGHAYSAEFERESKVALLLGGSLEDDYIFTSMHIHWGSEHVVNGKRYSAEMHLVHHNAKYSAEEAASKPDGLAVVAIFLQEDEDGAHSAMSHFLEDMTDDDRPEDRPIKDVTLEKLLPDTVQRWVRYQGSLTTPPCSESVKWTVLLEPVFVRPNLVKRLRAEGDDSHHSNSYRPAQPLNGRTIYEFKKGFEPDNEIHFNSGSATSLISFYSLICALFVFISLH